MVSQTQIASNLAFRQHPPSLPFCLFHSPHLPPGFMPQLFEFGMVAVLSHFMAKGPLLRARSLLCFLCPLPDSLLWQT